MKIIITDTNKTEVLTLIDPNTGIDCILDIVGNADDLRTNEDGDYTMDAETYAWWDEYAGNLQEDLITAAELLSKFGYAAEEILTEELGSANDYDDHHPAYQSAFARISMELPKAVAAA